MTALTKPTDTPVAEYGDSILAIIAKAASDPNVDIDKMDRLLQMQERVQDRQAAADFADAMAKMQPELPVITANSEIKHNGKLIAKYATWDHIYSAIKPILSDYGFALVFRNTSTDTKETTTAVLMRGGHEETNSVTLDRDTGGAKNSVQAVGSSRTYGQRYSACPLIGITIQGDDDDGHAAGAAHPISVAQYNELGKRMRDLEVNEPVFFKVLQHSGTLEELPASKFARAMAQLDAKAKQASKAGA